MQSRYEQYVVLEFWILPYRRHFLLGFSSFITSLPFFFSWIAATSVVFCWLINSSLFLPYVVALILCFGIACVASLLSFNRLMLSLINHFNLFPCPSWNSTCFFASTPCSLPSTYEPFLGHFSYLHSTFDLWISYKLKSCVPTFYNENKTLAQTHIPPFEDVLHLHLTLSPLTNYCDASTSTRTTLAKEILAFVHACVRVHVLPIFDAIWLEHMEFQHSGNIWTIRQDFIPVLFFLELEYDPST